jgi:fibronectin type 3 domain-containing protein
MINRSRREENGSRTVKSEVAAGFIIFCCLLFAVCCVFASCGKKGSPTLKSYEKPVQPSGLKAVHREAEIILLWEFPKDKEPTIKGFHIMRSAGGDFEKIVFLESDQRTYSDTNFRLGIEYKYKIISQSLKDILSNDSNILAVKPAELPAPPENLSFKVEHDSLTLEWKSAGEGTAYNIYRSIKSGEYSLMPVNKEPVKETLYRDSFTVNKPVYYTVRSLKGSAIRDEGRASGEIKVDTEEFTPSAPGALTSVATEDKIYLSWKEPPETWVTGYRVYREMTKEEGYKLIGKPITPSFIDKDDPLTQRNYKVTAVGPSREGPPAEISGVVFIKPR